MAFYVIIINSCLRILETGVFPSLDHVSGTLCLSHYVTETSHLYSLRDFWRHFGLCRAVAHSDLLFCAVYKYSYLLAYLLAVVLLAAAADDDDDDVHSSSQLGVCDDGECMLLMTGEKTSRADKTTTACGSECVQRGEAVQTETSAVTHWRHPVNTETVAMSLCLYVCLYLCLPLSVCPSKLKRQLSLIVDIQ